MKPPTLFKWEATRKLLVQFFRDTQPIRDITEGRAEEFHAWLTASDKPTATKRYSQNTVRKHIARGKQFFTVARRQQLIHANPFEGLKSTMISSHDRYYFLSQDDSDRILDACPNNEWRLIFALARYGGLRIPSELSTLTWDAID